MWRVMSAHQSIRRGSFKDIPTQANSQLITRLQRDTPPSVNFSLLLSDGADSYVETSTAMYCPLSA